MGTYRFPKMALAAAAGAIGLAACGGEVSPTGSTSTKTGLVNLGEFTSSNPVYGKIKVCKSASSNVDGTFTVSRVAEGGGIGTVLANPTIAPGTCVVVAEDGGGSGVGSYVRVDETSAGLQGVSAQRIDRVNNLDVVTNEPVADNDSRFLNQFHGFTITYVNTIVIPPPPPPPPVGGQGCSPGYWKNHNFPGAYTKSQLFSDVFENAFSGKTLQEVLSTGGGGLTALGRHTVSALLNASALGSTYEYTTAEVIAKFNAVFPGGNYSGLAAEFEALQDVNGRICPNPTGK